MSASPFVGLDGQPVVLTADQRKAISDAVMKHRSDRVVEGMLELVQTAERQVEALAADIRSLNTQIDKIRKIYDPLIAALAQAKEGTTAPLLDALGITKK